MEKNLGTYTISEKAFNDITNIICKNIKNIYPVKKDADYGECKYNKQKEMIVNISLKIKKGIDIVKICSKIQNEVKENILLMTGVEVKNVNIDIQGFENK